MSRLRFFVEAFPSVWELFRSVLLVYRVMRELMNSPLGVTYLAVRLEVSSTRCYGTLELLAWVGWTKIIEIVPAGSPIIEASAPSEEIWGLTRRGQRAAHWLYHWQRRRL